MSRSLSITLGFALALSAAQIANAQNFAHPAYAMTNEYAWMHQVPTACDLGPAMYFQGGCCMSNGWQPELRYPWSEPQLLTRQATILPNRTYNGTQFAGIVGQSINQRIVPTVPQRNLILNSNPQNVQPRTNSVSNQVPQNLQPRTNEILNAPSMRSQIAYPPASSAPSAAPANSQFGKLPSIPKGMEGVAKLPVAEQIEALKQRTCPVTKQLLGSMGKPIRVSVSGRSLFVCCDGCVDSVKENPAKYLNSIR